MERARWACLAICALALVCTVAGRHVRDADFDYLYLVRSWPVTYCDDHFCTHRPPKRFEFTIHGLWPQRNDDTWPEFCDSSSHIREEDIEDLLPWLDRVWPSWSSQDLSFWDHEWSRHGTCARPVVGGIHKFFKSVLKMHERYHIEVRAAGGIGGTTSRFGPRSALRRVVCGGRHIKQTLEP